jgi:tRNA nucleotidyltransferase (CCA-adding enzyme)
MGMNIEPILRRITPTPKEHEEEMQLVKRVFKLVEAYAVKPILVGSLAKNTDLSGNKDIDIFIQFTPDTTREELEKQGLTIGKEIFKKLGVEHEIDYAEHPYVKGNVGEHAVEIVPCYTTEKILSAVDRTPHHTTYVKKKLTGNHLNDEIRLLKQFMRGIGIYGAEAKVEGFSGYLVELLTIHYGSFIKTLEAARQWRIPEIIDPERLWDEPQTLHRFFTNASLIVIDPVDKTRNVAAAVSPECRAKFIIKSDEYILKPQEEFFFPRPKKERTVDKLKDAMKARKSKFIAVLFKHEKINTNTLYAQLRKTAKHVSKELQALEFTVFRTGIWTNEKDKSTILIEVETWELPELTHHIGPPIDQDAINQERFAQKYKNDKPYIKDGRWVVNTKRRYRQATEAMHGIIADRKGFGKNLRELEVAKTLVDADLFKITDQTWLTYLNEYLE